MTNPGSLYLALPRNVFGTPLEEYIQVVVAVSLGAQSIESSNRPTDRNVHVHEMVRAACTAVVVLPFLDGKIGLDVATEAKIFIEKKLPCFVILLPPDISAGEDGIALRPMTEEEKICVMHGSSKLVLSNQETSWRTRTIRVGPLRGRVPAYETAHR